MKILVAEDDPVTRESIETALYREGFIVFAVENGVHAVAAWKTEKPEFDLSRYHDARAGWVQCLQGNPK